MAHVRRNLVGYIALALLAGVIALSVQRVEVVERLRREATAIRASQRQGCHSLNAFKRQVNHLIEQSENSATAKAEMHLFLTALSPQARRKIEHLQAASPPALHTLPIVDCPQRYPPL